MRVLVRLGIVVVTAVVVGFAVAVHDFFAMLRPPEPVVTKMSVPGLGVVQKTFSVFPSLADSTMECTFELFHDDGRRIVLGTLVSEDRACELQRAPVFDNGALIVTSNIGYIVWRDGAPPHVIKEDCRLRIADAANPQGAVTCLFAFNPVLELDELAEPGEAGETWRLLVK